jgi:hypothetical protein
VDWASVFTRLGRHYAWATPDRVADLTYPQISMYLRGIGDNLYREAYPALRLGYVFEAFARSFQQNPSPPPAWLEFVPLWMQTEGPRTKAAPYIPAVVAAWKAAVRLGVASNHDLALLGYQNLKDSGW